MVRWSAAVVGGVAPGTTVSAATSRARIGGTVVAGRVAPATTSAAAIDISAADRRVPVVPPAVVASIGVVAAPPSVVAVVVPTTIATTVAAAAAGTVVIVAAAAPLVRGRVVGWRRGTAVVVVAAIVIRRRRRTTAVGRRRRRATTVVPETATVVAAVVAGSAIGWTAVAGVIGFAGRALTGHIFHRQHGLIQLAPVRGLLGAGGLRDRPELHKGVVALQVDAGDLPERLEEHLEVGPACRLLVEVDNEQCIRWLDVFAALVLLALDPSIAPRELGPQCRGDVGNLPVVVERRRCVEGERGRRRGKTTTRMIR